MNDRAQYRGPIVLTLALAVLAAPAFAQEEGMAMSPEEQAMMQAYMEAATPGEHHQALAAAAGDWTFSLKSWNDPSQTEPMMSEGTAVREAILGGRVLQEKVNSSFMGMPFEGVGTTGYDNVTGKFWSTWCDNMSTGLMTSEGSAAEDGTIIYHGSYTDPVTKQDKKVKTIYMSMGADKEVVKMYEVGEEGDRLTMEMTYQRAK